MKHVFVCLLYHIRVRWKDLSLQELWLIHNWGMRRSKCHSIIYTQHWETSSHGVFPGLHALTGCDTTSKISAKVSTLKVINKIFSLIHNFKVDRKHDGDVINILGEMSQGNNRPGEIWLPEYNIRQLEFVRTPFTWVNARIHIQGAQCQQQLWIQAPFRDATLGMITKLYGLVRKGNNGSWYSNHQTWRPV